MGWRLRLSDKTVRKFAELPIYCQRQKCSPGNIVSGSIRFMQIFAGVRWTWGVKWECGRWKWRFSLHSFTVNFPNILHTWPHDSFQTIRLSMTLGIFQGHWTVSHQISQKRCVTRQKLLYTTNSKSYISFRLVRLLMTLKYIWRSFQPRLSFPRRFQQF